MPFGSTEIGRPFFVVELVQKGHITHTKRMNTNILVDILTEDTCFGQIDLLAHFAVSNEFDVLFIQNSKPVAVAIGKIY